MRRKIKIQKVSAMNIGITIAMAVLFAVIALWSWKEFDQLRVTTNEYITCEKAAKQLQEGSDYLTEQVRLYAMTGERQYMDLYFKEADETKRRENALENLKQYFDNTETFESLQNAMSYSQELMETEYYSMRLVSEAVDKDEVSWPEEIKARQLSAQDAKLSDADKMTKAQQMVSDDQYQEMRVRISSGVNDCLNSILEQTQNSQSRASDIFIDMYRKLVICVAVLIILMLIICMMVRKLIVKPLMSYNESITRGEIFPVIGAAELQNLAETYNKVYLENQDTQALIRHKAEHDALTDLLNRGSFEKLLKIHEEGDSPFAMILVDVDTFKSVNDTFGHATGDAILKKVSDLLSKAFRSIDYVCRIGGDEFAIIMVQMTPDLRYTIEEKIAAVNEMLANPDDNLPKVSLSVGVAFSQRENPGKSIFQDADKALYYSKEHGRNQCHFY